MADRGDPEPHDTIFAPAAATGRAAVQVIRLSGPACRDVCRRLTGRDPPVPRRATLRALREPDSGELLDRGLVLWFPGPASVTGEDVLELQVHGGRAVLDGLVRVLGDSAGLRPAEAGEFTRRAWLNDRLDLTAVEGLADLVAAETRAQARQAMRQLEGELGRLYDGWRERLLAALARIEAAIDFADEGEVPDDLVERARPELDGLSAEIGAHLADGRRGERLREGLTIAVVGAPNAGKSSLINRLALRDVAIVAPTPGTTRDIIEVHLELDGLPVTLLDTAGIREPADAVEAEGVWRARNRAARADLRLLVLDGAAGPEQDGPALELADAHALVVLNKIDLAGIAPETRAPGWRVLRLSCRTGEGIDGLLSALGEAAAARLSGGDGPALTRARHRAALQETAAALARVMEGSTDELALVAEDLRLAARALGRITGRVAVDDLLDRIFSEFCIGK